MFLLGDSLRDHFIKGALAFALTVKTVEGDGLHPVDCEGDCEVMESRSGEFVARKVHWDLDLAIEARPIFESDPEAIFQQLFHSVEKEGSQIAGKTDTRIDLSDLTWSADFDCEKSTPREPRRCYVKNDASRFEWHHLITGGPRVNESEGTRGVFAVSKAFYQGLPVIKPRVRVRVFVGWPATGIHSITESWRKPILESIYMILGHEKLHVDNFLRHLPEIAQKILRPPIEEFEVMPEENPREKLDRVARATVLDSINRELFDPRYSECKRMNCIYDGKGPNCDSSEKKHEERRIAAAWDAPTETASSQWTSVLPDETRKSEDEKLMMFVDRDSHYPGPKSPRDFNFPMPFEFRWASH